MKAFTALSFGLLATMAICAIFAMPAFAEIEVLVEGKALTAETEGESEGEFTLVKYAESKSTTLLDTVVCSYIYTKDFVPNTTLDWDTDLYNLLIEPIGTLVDENKLGLSCTVVIDAGALTDCKAGSLATVWVVGMNLELGDLWDLEYLLNNLNQLIELWNPLNNLNEPVGFDVECESLIGVKGSEECTEGEISERVENDTGVSPAGLSEVSEETAPAISERENCTMTGSESAWIEDKSVTWADKSKAHVETAIN